MSADDRPSRWDGPAPRVEPEWVLRRLNAPSRLWGANGIAFGPDGRLYVAQYLAGMISALDPASGDIEPVVPPGGPVRSPDDLAFAADGSMYVADLVPGRVWRRDPAGGLTLVTADVPVVNGITCVGDRLFVNEMRPDGRLLEVGPADGGQRLLAGGLALGNAMQCGPDGLLYYPHMVTGEVWRVSPDGGAAERVAQDLPAPVAVRFDRAGVLYVLSCGPGGLVFRVDLAAGGDRTELRTGLTGLDNAAFDEENRMYVSCFTDGGVVELSPDGRVREIVRPGLAGPFGVAVGPNGTVHAADHYRVVRPGPEEHAPPVTDGRVHFAHAVAADADGSLHLTSQYGQVTSWDPATGRGTERARGLSRPAGVALRADGALVVAESGAGRVLLLPADGDPRTLAAGLGRPLDVAFDAAGGLLVSDADRGTVLRLAAAGDDPQEDGYGPPEVVAAGLEAPEGIAVRDSELYVVERGAHRLTVMDLGTGVRRTVVEELPLAPPHDGELPELPLHTHSMPGVPRPFAGVAAAPDGSVVLA
ncbi:hypothetical protein, partial [Streptomyces spiramenti]|uniref:hypothetical protein n=1 Tax=Streptomyces spiramenti TaxID=2720606 RepID=UPI0030845C85